MKLPFLDREDADSDRLLVGEVKWSSPASDRARLRELKQKIARLPLASGREVIPVVWLASSPDDLGPEQVVTPRDVLDALR